MVIGPDLEGNDYPTLSFVMTLNDLKGGTATATLLADTGSGYAAVPGTGGYPGSAVYDPAVVTGDTWSDSVCCVIDPPAGGGIAGKAKIRFEIVYPDGVTDEIETEALPIHMGDYARMNESYGTGGRAAGTEYDAGTGSTRYTMSFDIIIDDTLVDPADVSAYYSCMVREGSWTWYTDPDILRYTAGDGTSHMRFTFVSASPFPDGTYWFDPGLSVLEDANNEWQSEAGMDFTIS